MSETEKRIGQSMRRKCTQCGDSYQVVPDQDYQVCGNCNKIFTRKKTLQVKDERGILRTFKKIDGQWKEIDEEQKRL